MEADSGASDIAYGEKLCCDYESWPDGSYDCALYTDTGVQPDGEEGVFESI